MASQQTISTDSKRLNVTRVSELPGVVDAKRALIEAVRDGLSITPKTLPFPFFYDEIGSTLFDEICTLPEYYPTRTEDEILRTHADAMVDGWKVDQGPTLVELGSGSAEKTKKLIAAGIERYGRLQYVPIDVSETAVEESSKQLLRVFPKLTINAYVGDYHSCLADVAKRFVGPKMVLFLGSSLGNYDLESAEVLLRKLAFVMNHGDRLLLGLDLVKEAAILEPAYDDAKGVTARFNKNILWRINRELNADFQLADFEHKAFFNHDLSRVEMHLASRIDQVVKIPDADLEVRFQAGETIHTESSHKFRSEDLKRLLDSSGFEEDQAWTDSRGWFRVQSWRISKPAS